MDTTPEHLDVLIVGAGISGVGAGHHLRERCPQKSFAILEAREDMGGTWDLFRYPGIRSDSDMHTLGFRFKPWTDSTALADGPSILSYLREAADEAGLQDDIRYRHKVVSARWSEEEARWTVGVERTDTGESLVFTCDFFFICSGYYDYDQGYSPEFPDIDRFGGQVVHPQHWPEDLDYAGKRVLVIGSGATAVTLVPAMAEETAHITMLQRSPSYVLPLPSKDPIANWLRGKVSEKRAYAITRRKNILRQALVYKLSQRFPDVVRKLIRKVNEIELRGSDCDVDVHFKPKYDPWDQRLCAVPDGDLYRALRKGQASVVTDHIETFTATGIKLRSGRELEAD